MKHVKAIFVIVSFLTTLSSCINRTAYLIPEEPLGFYENGILFSIDYFEHYPGIIYSEPNSRGGTDRISEQIFDIK
jgi:hypothetical protein